MSVRRLSKTFISGAGAAAEKSSSFIAGYSPAIDEMDLIERVVVGSGGTSSITFSNIPQTYQHLQIRGVARNTGTTNRSVSVQFNGDTTSSYAWHLLGGNGSSTAVENGVSQTNAQSFSQVYSNASANIFSAFVMDILDYSSVSKNTTIRTIGSREENGAGLVSIYSGLWNSTSAVTSIKLYPLSDSLAEYTTLSLYGVKA